MFDLPTPPYPAPTPQPAETSARPDQPLDDCITLDLSPYELPGYRQQGASALTTVCIVVAAEPGSCGTGQVSGHYLVKFGQAAIAERLYYNVARHSHLPQQRVFWGGIPGAPDLIAAAIRLQTQAFTPEHIDPIDGSVTYQGICRAITNGIDYLRHQALRAFLGADRPARAFVRGERLIGVSAADCTPYARDAAFWQWYVTEQRQSLPAAAAVVVIEALETLARHPDITDLIGDDLERSPFPGLQNGLEEYYVDAVAVTHAGLVEFLRSE
jgi:hypothetical protein